MGNQDRDRRGSQSKPPAPPGISASEARLNERMAALEKQVRDQFDEKNHWNSMVREWIGKQVLVSLLAEAAHEDGKVEGTLLWVDRYTLCVRCGRKGHPVIIHKAAVATIRPAFHIEEPPNKP